MRHLKLLYFLLGAGLLVFVIFQTDLRQVAQMALSVGWRGFALLLLIYLFGFAIDVVTFQMALLDIPLDARWFWRTFKIRLVGEFFNTVIPAGGMGGEPVKALMLKNRYGIGLKAGAASLLLGKTVNMIALVIFLAGGFAFMLQSEKMPALYKSTGGIGLLVFALCILAFFLIQRTRLTSRLWSGLASLPFGSRLLHRLQQVREFDDKLVHFYTRHKIRVLVAVSLAILNWLVGVAEVWTASWLLGHPVSLIDAWIIEAAIQLARAAAFLMPASLGVQEGTFLLFYAAIAGSGELGMAVALLRRARELIWLGWGGLAGLLYLKGGKDTPSPSASPQTE
jgi:uncharacterized protein (TIRG00374 family)